MCVDLLAALLPQTLDDSGRGGAIMIRELKLALGAYLAAVTPAEAVDRLTEAGT